MRFLASLLLAAAVAGPAAGGEPCTLDPKSEYVVAVHLFPTKPGDPLVAGAALVIDLPETKVGLVGEGIHVPPGTISGTPTGMVATANDLGQSVRIVLAQPEALNLAGALLRLRFRRCAGAPAPELREFSCTLTDAADPATNEVGDLGCVVTVP